MVQPLLDLWGGGGEDHNILTLLPSITSVCLSVCLSVVLPVQSACSIYLFYLPVRLFCLWKESLSSSTPHTHAIVPHHWSAFPLPLPFLFFCVLHVLHEHVGPVQEYNMGPEAKKARLPFFSLLQD